MNNQPEILDVALDALDQGYAPIPCSGKVPLVKWKVFQSQRPTREQVRQWFAGTNSNIAILTTNMVVFDCDDPELVKLVLEHCGETTHMIRTPRSGIHLGYRLRANAVLGNKVKIRGLDLDIRTTGGIEVIPPSKTEFGAYTWLTSGLCPVAELPCGNIGWTRERVRKRVQSALLPSNPDVMFRRARAWIATVEGTETGQGRCHKRTFRIACRLTHFPTPDDPNRGFGLDRADALQLLLWWNQTCVPPWSVRELEHKIDDAIKKR